MVRTVLVANPTAQSGRAQALIEKASKALDSHGCPHDFVATEPNGGTVALVRRAINGDGDGDGNGNGGKGKGARRIIYLGGDGTFAEVAKGILASNAAADTQLGMLPTGTANDQGKSFGLAAGAPAIETNVAVIAAGHTTAMDVGRIQAINEDESILASDLFFDSMSAGFGAAVLATRNRDRQLAERIPFVRHFYRDQLVYAGALIKQLAQSASTRKTFNLAVTIDGQEHYFESVLDVIVKNTRIYGGEWVLSPDARSDDGLFELVPVAGHRDYTSKMLATLRHSPIDEPMLAKLGIRHSEPIRGARFELTVLAPWATEPPAAQIDGEEFPRADKFSIEVLPRILNLIVPQNQSEQPVQAE